MKNRIYKGSNKIIFGVCSGFAEYFETDPLVFRLLFLSAFLLLPSFISVMILYLISALIMPSKDDENNFEF